MKIPSKIPPLPFTYITIKIKKKNKIVLKIFAEWLESYWEEDWKKNQPLQKLFFSFLKVIKVSFPSPFSYSFLSLPSPPPPPPPSIPLNNKIPPTVIRS